MNKHNLKQLLADKAVMEEIQSEHGRISLESAVGVLSDGSESNLDVLLSGNGEDILDGNYSQLEAIVVLTGRPPLLIQDGKWEEPSLGTIRARLDRNRDALLEAIPKVGRVEVLNYGDYLGTGWMIDEGIMITNRHVAEVFSVRTGSGLDFKRGITGERCKARVDFRREYERTAEWQAKVCEIVFLEEAGGVRPDMALIRLDSRLDDLPTPIPLDDANPEFDTDIAVIGYPTEDSRNDAFAMKKIFGGVYNVKRLSPGKVRGIDFDGKRLVHDCTTLGGNSGSVVINLNTGKACGLHFSGNYRVNNYAVSVGWLKSRLAEINHSFSVTTPGKVGGEEPRPATRDFSHRKGYNTAFLGDENSVPLPTVSDAAMIASVDDEAHGELRYTHFSIVMHKERRLPFFTACNIDGQLLYNFPRGRDRWYLDKRLVDHTNHQIGEDLYARNSLDRGHLVRRLDPAWGTTREEAKEAEMDTFFFTNCSPQHSQLNQRTWLNLEDYVLGNAGTHDLKVSVFTGPVMSEKDRIYRGIQIPEEFWKVVVILNSFTGRLSATAYLLSQAEQLDDLEFVFGEFRTYQVTVSELEAKTGLSFGDLSTYDPMGKAEGLARRVISSSMDLVL
jgi:endonuclease G